MKKVAVLIPTHKPGKYIARCLQSLSAQTLPKNLFCVYVALNGKRQPFEKYVLGILSTMRFHYKYIYIQQEGVSNARNTLLDYSDEEFIAFIDDDDCVSENYLHDLLHVATNRFMAIADAYSFKDSIDNLDKHNVSALYKKTAKKDVSKIRTRKYYSSVCAKVIHRNMIEESRFDVKLQNGEDSLFFTEISKNITGVCKPDNDAVYYVFKRENSISRRKTSFLERTKNHMYLLSRYCKIFLTSGYEKIFILTRIAAALKKLIFQLN